MIMSFDIVNRKRFIEAFARVKKQLNLDTTTQLRSHEIERLCYDVLGVSHVIMRSDPRNNTARVEVADDRKYFVAKLKYGF